MTKSIGILSVSALFLLLGFSAAAVAHQEPQEKPQDQEELGKPPQQKPEEKPAEPAKQEHQQPQPEHQAQPKPATPPKQEQRTKTQPQQHSQQSTKTQSQQPPKDQAARSEEQQPQHAQQQAKTQQEQSQKQEANSGKTEQQAHGNQPQQASNSQAPHRSQQAMDRQHAQPELRLSSRGSGRIPDDRFHSNFGRGHEFRMGNPVIVSGYSRFQYGGYWFGYVQPWPNGWYYTDEVYIDYVDGEYYMFNPYYPGVRFALTVMI